MDAPAEDGSGPASPADLARAEAETQVAIVEAARVAQAAGKLPGSIERMLGDLLKPRVDWRAVLRRWTAAIMPADYSWTRPNRRFAYQGLYLPGIIKDGAGEWVLSVDSSGSTNAHQEQFGSEMTAILGECKPARLWVVYSDSQIQHVESYVPGDTVILKTYGGGGTNLAPPFDWVEEQGIEPQGMIYLTDLIGRAPDHPPAYPVLWACTKKENAGPWGETVYIGD